MKNYRGNAGSRLGSDNLPVLKHGSVIHGDSGSSMDKMMSGITSQSIPSVW